MNNFVILLNKQMHWIRRKGDFHAIQSITGWLVIFVILVSTKNGNGHVTQQLQKYQIPKLAPPEHHNSNKDLLTSSSNSLELSKNLNTNHNNNNNNKVQQPQQILIKNSNSLVYNTNSSLKNLLVKSTVAAGATTITSTTSSPSSSLAGMGTMRSTTSNNKQNNTSDIDSNTVDNSELKVMNFSTENSTQVTYQVGSIALIPCSVQNLGEGMMVSWIRRKDYHLITVGSTTYSSDARFSAIHLPDSEDWTLQIKFVQIRDIGLYECQVSTHPPTSIFVNLSVVEARAEIPGDSEKFLKPGSTLRLSCRVLQSMDTPLYLFWYHNNRMINYDLHRGVNVSTDPDNRYSELLILQTSLVHTGNYTCSPNNAVPASVLVHILNGENPAAMQHGEHGYGIYTTKPSYQLIKFFIGFLLLFNHFLLL